VGHPRMLQKLAVKDLATKAKVSRGWGAQAVLQSIRAGLFDLVTRAKDT
jgi:hypothetical protein